MNYLKLRRYLAQFPLETRYGKYRKFYEYCTPFLLQCRELDISIPVIADFLRQKMKDENIITQDLFKFCRDELKLDCLRVKRNDRKSNKRNNRRKH